MKHILFALFLLKSFLFAEMTLDEKIGQLFVIPLTSKLTEESYQEALSLIEKYKIGGILLQKSTPLEQINMVLSLQKDKEIPFITLQDAEWGLEMRLEGAIKYPKNLTLGAIVDDDLIYQFGKEVGRELKLVGTGVGLLPVVDVYSNPLNPIIGDRSFGDNPYEVAKKGYLVAKGLKDSLVFASAKHFPGHGDTANDSHVEIPYISCDLNRLENLELIPFKKLIDEAVDTIMIGHIQMGDIDNLPASLSSKIIKGLLKEKLKFNGLVITDALNMKAISDNFSIAEAALFAYLAGNDLLLYGHHLETDVLSIYREYIPKAFTSIKHAVENGIITKEDLDAKVDKIIKAKQKLGFLQKPSTLRELFPKSAYDLKRNLYRSALTYLSNSPKPKSFDNIVYLKGLNKNYQENYGIKDELLQEIYDKKDKISLIVIFGSPWVVPLLPHNVNILVAYEENEDTIEAVKDFLDGKLEAKGKLPITIYQNQELQTIVDKLWSNECSSKFTKLTHWNDNENFASLGIGHFIWFTNSSNEPFDETFPRFIEYVKAKNYPIPSWLDDQKSCPWLSKEAFYNDFETPNMKKLRYFLFKTRYLQAEFILLRLEESLEKIVNKAAPEKQLHVKNHFKNLMKNPKGSLALLDFINFKGDGTHEKERYNQKGWGLLQVLEKMPQESHQPLLDFVCSAKEVLIERVKNAPIHKNEERWLKGWVLRIESYLK